MTLAPLLALTFPAIGPVAIEIGPLAIRWYALAYVFGLLLGWQYVRLLARRGLAALDLIAVDDLLLWITLGVVLGGRAGYVLFYRPDYYFSHPIEVLAVWQGGMSFHGGLLGVLAAVALFGLRRGIPFLTVADALAPVFPLGLGLGRVANFINGELFGRVSDAPWAMVFPRGGPLPRHPSQLYEAGLEGVLLLAVMLWLVHVKRAHRWPGFLSGAFLTGYALARGIGELFREPDFYLGYLAGGLTMGQMLSLPMAVAGVWLMVRAPRVR